MRSFLTTGILVGAAVAQEYYLCDIEDGDPDWEELPLYSMMETVENGADCKGYLERAVEEHGAGVSICGNFARIESFSGNTYQVCAAWKSLTADIVDPR